LEREVTCPDCGKLATLIAWDGHEPTRVFFWLCVCGHSFMSYEDARGHHA
jgi:acetone carboxylase gamma subunit